MPIVLATAEGEPRSGYVYDDRTGVSYEYPDIYRRRVIEGEPFIYHIPRRGYTGSGVVGQVTGSNRPGHSVCQILDYRKFESSVPLRSPGGYYFEADPERGKLNVYWSRGVRPISDESYEEVISIAQNHPQSIRSSSVHVTSGLGRDIRRFAVQVALERLADEYPGAEITPMAHGHPGFDIRIGPAHDPVAFVGVKGTQTAEPFFRMTEGERLFSIREAERYRLIIVTGIDPSGLSAYVVHFHSGSVDGAAFELAPNQWRGSLITGA